MDELMPLIKASYYTQLLMGASSLLALILTIVNRKKFSELKFIWMYPLASLLQLLFFYSMFLLKWPPKSRVEFSNLSINIYILIEAALIYHFLFQIIILKKLRSILKIILAFFIIYLSIHWIANSFFYYPAKAFLVQSFIILIPCSFYLIQLFKTPPTIDLLNTPAFWITIGLLFYFSSTFPLFLWDSIESLSANYYSLYSINFVAYSILFLLIAKASTCKPSPTKQ